MALFGPREPVDAVADFDPVSIGADVDAYFAAREARFDDITPGVEKRVVWAGEAGAKTPLSILYVHGFSATSEEIRPVPDRVADGLGANLVYTRLTGHGRSGEALAAARAGDWIEDYAEAMAVARRVGERVIVMSTSTGATIATIAAQNAELEEAVAGHIFVSPNFGIKNPAAVILTWPGVRWWGPLIAGRERSFPSFNDDHERYWTNRYPTVAVIPMVATVKAARAVDHTSLKAPLLAMFSDDDGVVSSEATRAVTAKWGGPVQTHLVTVGPGDDPNSHVIAGDILSPGQTDEAVRVMLNWAQEL